MAGLRTLLVLIAAAAISVVAAVVPAGAAMAAGTGTVTGVVGLDGVGPAPSSAVKVAAFIEGNTLPTAEVATDASGRYELTGLPQRDYLLRFAYVGAAGFADAWWTPEQSELKPYAADASTASPVLVGEVPVVADLTLPRAGRLSGTVTQPPTQLDSPPTVIVRRLAADGSRLGYPITVGPDFQTGAYEFARLLPGTYQVEAWSGAFLSIWYGADPGDPATPGRLDVGPGGDYRFDAVLLRGADVSGTVSCAVCVGPIDVSNTYASVERWNATTGRWTGASSDWLYEAEPGRYLYQSGSLYPGTYRVLASFDLDGRPFTLTEPFEVAEGESLTRDITVTGPEIVRLAGDDRYATAAAVSKQFDPGVPVAFVASGLGFADALAAGPAAAKLGGPVLLVTGTSIPPSTQAELERLDPQRIIVVGGESVVSAAVTGALGAFAPTVERIGGSDRYDTSRKVAMRAFGEGGSVTAYVASGLNFPDAVSAGAAAAHRAAPVLLVNGANGEVDAATKQTLGDLGAVSLHIIGGTAVVHPGIESSLATMTGVTVTRHGGDDRFDTSHLVNADAFDQSTVAFIASGLNFPDALAGAAYAGSLDAPLFLAPGGCVTSWVVNDLQWMNVQRVVLLGGPAVLSLPVEKLATC